MEGLEGRGGVEFWFRIGDSVGITAEMIVTAGMQDLGLQQ